MRRKLGLKTDQAEDAALVSDLLQTLDANDVDYTRFFRRLCDFSSAANNKNDVLQGMFIDPSNFDDWARRYRVRLAAENSVDAERSERMRRVNPKFVLRNHLAQNAIERAQAGDYTEVNTLLDVLQKPFEEQPEMEKYAEPPLEGSKRIAVSCSS
jgi:uncharacterized protein YdiU (UPF0061 family)